MSDEPKIVSSHQGNKSRNFRRRHRGWILLSAVGVRNTDPNSNDTAFRVPSAVERCQIEYCTVPKRHLQHHWSYSTQKPLEGAPVNTFTPLYWYDVGDGICLLLHWPKKPQVRSPADERRVALSLPWWKQQKRRVVPPLLPQGRGQPLFLSQNWTK